MRSELYPELRARYRAGRIETLAIAATTMVILAAVTVIAVHYVLGPILAMLS